MPNLCQVSSRIVPLNRLVIPQSEYDLDPPSQGPEGQYLDSILTEIREHNLELAESLLQLDEEMEDNSINHMRLQPTRFVRTTYKFIGRMKPRKIDEHD